MVYNFNLEKDEEGEYGRSTADDLNTLLGYCKTHLQDYDETIITKAFWTCYNSHKGVIRKSGFEYYTHPLRVATILMTEFPTSDTESVVACLLHDTIEDVDEISKEKIEHEFNADIAELVDGVTKIRHEETSKMMNTASTYRKIFLSLVKDIRVILIKLADRLHNLRTLHYMNERKQVEIAKETLYFYTPLAHRLGLTKIKAELENLSFLFSDPEAYSDIKDALYKKQKDFTGYIGEFNSLIKTALENAKIDHLISVIHKHEYEIYKMMNNGVRLEDIDNFYSVVVILDSNDISDCYKAHGVLANAFKTVHFVDHISGGKPDWYKSLYSEIYGPDGKKIEMLIRTQEMEQASVYGFASKYSLERGRKRAIAFSEEDIELWGQWMQEIIEQEGDSATKIIWNSIKVNLFDSDITVISKEGKEYSLPRGATLIDYAFSKSDSDGFRLISAKVNGWTKDITYQVKNGDKIEIFTSESSYPKPEWQDYVITKLATVRLFYYFKKIRNQSPKNIESRRVKLIVIGKDKVGMMNQFTNTFATNDMKELNVKGIENGLFKVDLNVLVYTEDELNRIILKTLLIDGIIKVERAA